MNVPGMRPPSTLDPSLGIHPDVEWIFRRQMSGKAGARFRIPRVVRVGVMTDYGHTREEEDGIVRAITSGPGNRKYASIPFVNSHAGDSLETPLPSFVTVNPYWHTFTEPRGPFVDYIRAIRVRWVSNAVPDVAKAMADAVAYARDTRIPVLWTRARFWSRDLLEEVCADPSVYPWGQSADVEGNHSFYWSPDPPPYDNVFAFCCDEQGLGCPACRLCSLLSYGIAEIPWALDLSASLPSKASVERGEAYPHCKWMCKGCFSRENLRRVSGPGASKLGDFLPVCDEIHQNAKQEGKESAVWTPASHFCFDGWCWLNKPDELQPVPDEDLAALLKARRRGRSV